MVEESLVQHLRTSLATKSTKNHKEGNEKELEQKLRALFVDDNEPSGLSKKTEKVVVDAFRTIKVLDPACGSGAFPVGILQKMLCALRKVDEDNDLWLQAQIDQIHDMKLDKREEDRRLDEIDHAFKTNEADYGRKLGIIQNSVYGVDIQPIAIEISKLRFFLTLVVDEKIEENEDNRGILPLPNLDFKFVCANTLIPAPEIENNSGELDLEYYPGFFKDFTALTEQYFYAGNPKEKQTIRDELSECVGKKVKGELNKVHVLQGNDLFEHHGLSKAKQKKIKEHRAKLVRNINLWESYKNIFTGDTVGFFDPQYMFPDAGKGFDVIIGNPPYVQLQNDGGKLAEIYKNADFETFARSGDIYSLFYERGWQLLKPDAHLCFITSNKWMRAGYGKATRRFFSERTRPVLLIDFAGQKIFESATVDTNILLFQRKTDAFDRAQAGGDRNDCSSLAVIADEKCRRDLNSFVRQNAVPTNFDGENSWVILSPIEQGIKQKIEAVGVPLKDWDISINYGIKTGYNEAFIIDEAKRNKILAHCKTEDERKRTDELIRPILRGRDVKRYGYVFADTYLIASHNGYNDPDGNWAPRIDMNDYPAIKKHLDSFEPRLSRRSDQGDTPYNLRSCAYMNDFSKPKIVWGEISDKTKFALDIKGEFCAEATTFLMTGKQHNYLTCYLNSTLSEYLFSKIGTTTGVGTVRWKKFKIEQLFVPLVAASSEHEWGNLLQSLREHTISENEINCRIYDLCNLSKIEVDFVESYSGSI